MMMTTTTMIPMVYFLCCCLILVVLHCKVGNALVPTSCFNGRSRTETGFRFVGRERTNVKVSSKFLSDSSTWTSVLASEQKSALLSSTHWLPLPLISKVGVVAAASAAVYLIYSAFAWINRMLWTPSRTYDKEKNTVGKEYDAWQEEGILEAYWGEHIHLGYYESENRPKKAFLPAKKDFIQAKYDFIDEMLKFSGFDVSKAPSLQQQERPVKILDVGCGIGGTSRYLAKKFGRQVEVTGITLSTNQQRRATDLATEQQRDNAVFLVMDALNMEGFDDNSFDLVWACESGEHMPDKKRYVEEMTRVLKPGGQIVIATWCQRDEGNKPFDEEDKRMLNFLYSEWTHPFFISISDYARLMSGTGRLVKIGTDDWTAQTIASWLHSIWVGVFNPIPVLRRPDLWWKTFRDGLTLYRMHKSFASGLMQYGMMTATKE